jgi:hypothetical protein
MSVKSFIVQAPVHDGAELITTVKNDTYMSSVYLTIVHRLRAPKLLPDTISLSNIRRIMLGAYPRLHILLNNRLGCKFPIATWTV